MANYLIFNQNGSGLGDTEKIVVNRDHVKYVSYIAANQLGLKLNSGSLITIQLSGNEAPAVIDNINNLLTANPSGSNLEVTLPAGITIDPSGTSISAGGGGGGSSFTTYTAILNQTGTNAPVATILENNTGYTYTWARIGTGEYTITASGNAFTSNKTLVFVNCGNTNFADPVPTWERLSDTEILIGQPPLGDGKFVNGALEIRIYS
jgi:hypothetical protein